MKRYAARPIQLEAVAALNAMVEEEGANRGLFVTSSRFLPKARAFAGRHSRRLILKDLQDVRSWCRDLALKSKPMNAISLTQLQQSRDAQSPLVGSIFHGFAFNKFNSFCLVVRQMKGTVFARFLTNRRLDDSPFFAREIPEINNGFATLDNERFFVAPVTLDGFWHEHTHFSLWGGEPMTNRFDPGSD